MHIGIDARIAHYARGGIRNYVLRLLERIPPLDPGNEYYVLYSRKARHPPVLGANVTSIPCWTPSHHRIERWALGVEIARLRLDLLHTVDFIPPAFGYGQSVITVHDLNFLYYPQFQTSESRRYYNDQIAWAVGRAAYILADSHATKLDLAELLHTPADKITVVHLAADAAFRPIPQAQAAQVARRYDLSPGYLLTVGTIEPRKNLPGLLQAYARLRATGTTEASLVVVGGKGWLYDEVFERVESLGLAQHVRFFHGVPDEDLPGLYNAASVLTTPSFYEGFGLPALEAMACGTPVVVADRASLPEVVGDAGLLVDSEDVVDIAHALTRVLTEQALRAQMRARGLQQAARFSWERAARETLAVYRQVLGR
ncbi:MAG TPA: glycosyltransferase family 1 protein [Chloroflexi bacterium]|nr:glycosyltransferase family 1 protein [Chloroflexota bacterium]